MKDKIEQLVIEIEQLKDELEQLKEERTDLEESLDYALATKSRLWKVIHAYNESDFRKAEELLKNYLDFVVDTVMRKLDHVSK